jgi:anti-sigma B factor antagonist
VDVVGDALLSTRRLADGTIVIEIRGEVDSSTATQLRDVLVDTATRRRPVRLVVDMLHVTFIDSTGIGALASGRNAAASVGVVFKVSNPGPFVAQQLRMLGLLDAFGLDSSPAGPPPPSR